MKRLMSILAGMMLCLILGAQTDSLSVATNYIAVDSTCLGLNIFDIMPSVIKGDAATVIVNQPSGVEITVRKEISSRSLGQVAGYRVRIFSSNAQNARNESLSTLYRFESNYPEHKAYRTYVLPNFKVTVGDFRTKSEALMLLNELRKDFPSSFVVKENINLRD